MARGVNETAVWVLEDGQDGARNPALGIVERLGVPFRRVPLAWNWLALAGSEAAVAGSPGPALPARPRGPALLISCGNRSAAAALWLKARLGSPIVQVMRPRMPLKLVGPLFDTLVIPQHDLPPRMPNLLPVLGLPHRVSPLALAQARAAWGERLDHLPHPRIALLVGGAARAPELAPALVHQLAIHVAALTQAAGGSVLATTTLRTGAEAEDALAAGLGRVMHVLYRRRDPGPNPYLGFLATADAVVVTAASIAMISEATATPAPVFIALPELAGTPQKHFLEALYAAGQARKLGDTLAPWPRRGLDETGRIAAAIARQFPLE
jgi:mitochondrial fission protein ELM1